MNTAPGISGGLFPSRYVADRLLHDAAPIDAGECWVQADRLSRWWTRVESTCGPATGVRALFDLAAMPLFGSLGFRASDAVFDRSAVRARLETPRGTPVALIVLPWAARPPGTWRVAVETASAIDAAWCFVLAPPFLSVLPSGGSAVRRSVDFLFPAAIARERVARFLTLACARGFDADRPHDAPMDRLVAAAASFQDRVRTDLQVGVIAALDALVPAVASAGTAGRPFDQALTVLFRILFLLFAESRELIQAHHPIYRDSYAMGALCRQARGVNGARGLWQALAAVTRLSRIGCAVDDLVVRPFNGRLFARAAAPALELRQPARRVTHTSHARDEALQRALVAVATRATRSGREEICYADLGVEQLGAVYERVLDLGAPPRPANFRRHSLRRKQTGTFYTPQDLTEFVVRRTLAPLVAGRSADEILALRVVDPAMGSGAFLVAACRYLASACQRALVDEGRSSAADFGPTERAGLRRLVAERCLAGVDVNPVAVQLARLSLWLATLSEGKPLGFLDHRLRTGNSLIGTWPDELGRLSVPSRSRDAGPLPLFESAELTSSLRQVTRPLAALLLQRDDSVQDVRAKEAAWQRLVGDRSPLAAWRRAADLWCARWFWPPAERCPSPQELRAAIDRLTGAAAALRDDQLKPWLDAAARAAACGFFHWPLEFADVFYEESGQPRDRPGFDAVIGNPPWEMLRADERGPAADRSSALVRFVRESGLFHACDRGHMNLYQPFLERTLAIVRTGGRIGLVLPWGLSVDDGAARLRERLFDSTRLDVIVGFDNANAIFPIHRGLRFQVVVATAGGCTEELRGRFGVKTREEIACLPSDGADAGSAKASYPVRLARAAIARIGGQSRRIPDLRRTEDLRLLEQLFGEHPALGSEEGWRLRFGRELNASEDRGRFGAHGLPVIEGKHIQPFVATVDRSACRIPPAEAARLLPARGFSAPRLAYRDVAGVTNRLSLIAAIVPAGVVTTHTLFCLRTPLPLDQQHFLCGIFNSFVMNAVVRLLMGGHVTTSLVEDLPVPRWSGSRRQKRIARLAAALARGDRRATTAAHLQASVARLYALDAATVAQVVAGFPLVSPEDRQLALQCFRSSKGESVKG